MIDIAISGARGRMGRLLAQLAGDSADIRIAGGIGRNAGQAQGAPAAREIEVVPLSDAPDMIRKADVVVDFSCAAFTRALLEQAGDALAGRALVVGTTGLDQVAGDLLDRLSHRAAVLVAPNFSIGVNLLLELVRNAAAALGSDHYDIEIVEQHHSRKVDAPSGTALALGAAAAQGRGRQLEELRPADSARGGRSGARAPGEIGFHAIRGGGVVGEHEVLFIGERERIRLGHDALDRALFADGALAAARWIAGRAPGRYTMTEVLGLESGPQRA